MRCEDMIMKLFGLGTLLSFNGGFVDTTGFLGLQGLLMAWFGYKANVQQTDQSLLGILLMMSLIPAVFGLLAAVAMRFYNLDEQKMARIEAEVAQRKANPM